MNTLLKDMPQFAERIENNYSLKQDINEIVGEVIDYPDDYSQNHYTEQLIEKITDFVNQNYTFKGDAR